MNIRLIGGATALLASLAVAGCATTSPGYTPGYGSPSYGTAPSSTSCYDCGTVTRIEVASTTSSNVPNATGAVLGGLVGAAAGHELARNSNTGRQNTATVAGAVAGAVAGNAIQNHAQAQGAYNIYVQMNDGRTTVVTQSDLAGIREGSYVRVTNGRAYLR